MNQDIKFSGSIFRKDFPMILACNRHLATILPVRLQYNASGYKAGTVLAQQTSGAASGTFAAYANGGASGLGTATCILFEPIDVSEFASGSDTLLARGIFGGHVFYDKLTGVDSGAVTSLGGKKIQDASGTNILIF